MARLTDKIPTKLTRATKPTFAASLVTIYTPTGPVKSVGACPERS
ncbi:MAG: hypothetical protein ACD_52C00319G0001 [uncultured bacterium]|nr:MAG: hypothetical protein ACD_52C00319G0001 [uncultured bacterium]